MTDYRFTFTELRQLFHGIHTNFPVGVKCKTAGRRRAFHAFHGFHTYRKGCVRSARPPARSRPPARLIHTPPSVGVKSVKSVKSQDGKGVIWGGGCETGVKFHTYTPEEVAA
jgi:hypothetical protein